MDTKKSIKLYGIINDMLHENGHVKIKVTGNSMYPFLRDQLDSVELVKTNFSGIRTNDIVMIHRDSGQYVVHRVMKKQGDRFFLVGDAQQAIEGPLREDQLIGLVVTVWRGNRLISCNNLLWRMLSRGWLLLRPYRYKLIRGYTKLRKLLH